jgi:putative ABC transport system substrate-binding protein
MTGRLTLRRVLTGGLVVIAVAGAAVACGDDDPPAAGSAVIAFLRAVASEDSTQERFLEVLHDAGYVPGDNLRLLAGDPIEAHSEPADVDQTLDRWRAQGVDLVVALSTTGAKAAAERAGDAEVLFISSDPVATGLVANERRPEGRMTGVTFRVPADRTLDLARRAVPGLRNVGFLYPPSDPPAAPQRERMQRAADELGLVLTAATFDGPEGVPAAVEQVRAAGVELIVIANAPSAVRVLPELEAAAEAAGLPVVANTERAGFALVVLEPDVDRLWLQLGEQAVRILGGAEPADVPVEDPAAFRLIVNLRTAAALGIAVAGDLVEQADEVVR